MSRKLTRLCLASTLLSGPVLSGPVWAEGPTETERAQQIVVVPASPLKRTEIIGVVGQPTTITFPKTEAIYRVIQTGKADKDGNLNGGGWSGPRPEETKDLPLGNNLPLWPVVPGESVMTVITKTIEGGEQKVYPFHLVALAEDQAGTSGVVFNLIFQGEVPTMRVVAPHPPWHPAAGAAAASHAPMRKQQDVAQVAAKALLHADAFNGAGGCHYVARGEQPNPITPRCPIDNGEWTVMRFPGLSKKPAVYVVTGKAADEERLARQHEEGDFVVVEEIAPLFRLRLGDDAIDIVNQAYDPAGHPGGAGTVAPSVSRDLINAAK